MNKLLLAAGAAGLLTASSVAALADQSMATITNIDPNSGSITLSDGYTYPLPASVALSSVTIGEHVTLTYTADANTGQRTATALTPSS